jgi:hypothetical protein
MGWLGIRLDRYLNWETIAAMIEEAYWTRAGKAPGAGRLSR